MAGQDVPPVEVTPQAIREELQGLHLDLKPDAGIGIAAVPLEVDHALQVWTEQLESIATDHAAVAAYAEAAARTAMEHLPDVAHALGEIAAWDLAEAIGDPISGAIESLHESVGGLGESLGQIAHCVCEIAHSAGYWAEEIGAVGLTLGWIADVLTSHEPLQTARALTSASGSTRSCRPSISNTTASSPAPRIMSGIR